MSNAALGAIRRYSRTTTARVSIDWYVYCSKTIYMNVAELGHLLHKFMSI